MKWRFFNSFVVAGLMYSTAFAEGNWVERFLDRYRAQQVSAPAVSLPERSYVPVAQKGVIALTTQDVVRLLLENNLDIKVSRLAPLSSFYRVSALARPFEPAFYAIANMDKVNSPSRNQLAGAPSLLELTNDLRVGFDQLLRTGTIYSVNVDFIRGSSNSAFNLFNPFYNGLITYSLTQHLLRDFGRAVGTRQIRIARNDVKMSELEFELHIVDLVTHALGLYWDLKFAEEDVKVKQRSLDLANKTLRDYQIQVEIGSLAAIDLVQAQADVAQRNEALVTAKYNIDLLQDELKKLISKDIDPFLGLTRLNLVEPVRRPDSQSVPSLDASVQDALENRREIKLAGYEVENRNIDVQYAKNQTRPILDITASYTQTGLGGRQTIRPLLGGETEIVQVVPGGISDVFSQIFGFNHIGYATGFNFRLPLRNHAARAEYDRALNERQISTTRKAAMAQQVVLEVRNGYTRIQMNQARVETSRITRELASRRLEAEQKKFELGTSTVRFVLEEQRNLAQAETDEIQALVNYTKAFVEYDRATGNTLQRNNIEIERELPTQVLSRP